MADERLKKHVPVPEDTPAFFCANCGAVSLSPDGICKVQGKGKKADWCGTKDAGTPQFCHNKKNNLRYRCGNCGKVSVNSELLCEPVKMELPE